MLHSHENEITEFERIGEKELRLKIAQGAFFGNRLLAEEWLRLKAESRVNSRISSAERRAMRAEIIAIIAAIAAIIVAIKDILAAIYTKS